MRRIDKLLNKPRSYKLEVAIKVILNFMAKFYRLTMQRLKETGRNKEGQFLARIIAAEVHQNLLAEKEISVPLIDRGQVQDRFSFLYDNRLLIFARSNERNRNTVEYFFYESLLNLAKRDDVAKRVIRNKEYRGLAFDIAISDFLLMVFLTGFTFEKNAKSLFFTIFIRKCKSSLTDLTKSRRAIAVNYENHILAQLSESARKQFFNDEPQLSNFHIETFEQKFPEEMRLIKLRHYGYTYEELGEWYGATPAAMRQRVHVARKKIKDFHTKNYQK